jgi:NAD(P)-dependent dehydrogenase (short-subunit alcohol dehydrogenase family)
MDLHGQRVVVLGGTFGIGLATAQLAVREQGNCRFTLQPRRRWPLT